MPALPDASGKIPLAALVEQKAKENLANITFLYSSIEYGFAEAAKETTLLRRELEAAKGPVFFLAHIVCLVVLHSFLHVLV